MDQKTLPFLEAFPNLALEDKVLGLLEHVTVERVTMNSAKRRLRIYLSSENWIKKTTIFELERLIKAQMFEGMQIEVKIIEHFHLSKSYTPEYFYKVYRNSMLRELKSVSPLLQHTFLHAELEFPDESSVLARIPDSILPDERRTQLSDYLEKVFHDRAGFQHCEVTSEFVAPLQGRIAEEELSVEDRIRSVVEANRLRHKEVQEEKKLPAREERQYRRNASLTKDPTVVYGKSFDDEPQEIAKLGEDPREVAVRGEVFLTESRETKNGRIIYTIAVTDFTDSVRLKLWFDKEQEGEFTSTFTKGSCWIIKGMLDFDPFDKELMIRSVYGIKRIPSIRTKRTDNAPVKRVELHCHTQMSDMDAVSPASSIVKQAYDFGMKALAITDHGVVQSFPEAYKTFGGKKGIPKDADLKILYGMEAYLVDDTKHIVSGPGKGAAPAQACVFQTVTTGASPLVHDILEIAGAKLEGGEVREEFRTLVHPGRPIPFSIQTETGITDEMVNEAPSLEEALNRFFAFAGELPLAAYDADLEVNFLYAGCRKCALPMPELTYIDIPQAARCLIPGLGRIRFTTLLRALKLSCEDDMRALPRVRSMSAVYRNLLTRMEEEQIANFEELNTREALSVDRIRNLPYYHAILLAKNEQGRRNLYTLVSESHLKYFNRRPRIPRSVLSAHREGLILGSACSAGELYIAILNGASEAEIARIVDYYDYLEIQPTGNNEYLIGEKKSGISSVEDLQNINRRIVELGELYNKPVCATCDVHFLNPEDWIYRAIIQAAEGFKDEALHQPPLFLRTTEEMLEEFSYLGDEKCREVVITNTNRIADEIERISPIHPDKCPPTIPHAEEDLHDMCYETAISLYGDPIPPVVKERLDKELNSIIKNGYAVMYIIAQKLVDKSNEDGYLVGSRGSVGSSLAATMSRITEVNPLPPHYRCGKCHYSDFDSEVPRQAHLDGKCGCDMPDRLCPVCGEPLIKDGFDIPFETFLGFKGDKEPDIDLNFSGDEQAVAQAYTEVIFGKGQTFKAGTIGTVAEKTAYGYVLHYLEDIGQTRRSCEVERLASGCVGVRRTTGQHPGGVIVLPKGMDINWFTPVQHPANDVNSPLITTHFDYHSIDTNLLKLDILGHDDPTIIRMLADLTGTDPKQVPLDDKGVLSLFTGTEALRVTADELGGVDLGTLGVPEFGTNFVMGMLRDTKPKTFSELIRISGLSHGTNVWLDNAQYFIREGFCKLGTAICTRDDIMLNLINWGVEPEHSFKIMEAVRKGKGLTADQEAEMREHQVPDWYIESCKRIKYMFPKAHAAAYVMNAFRIAYYKINYPLAYYAAMFSIRAKTFNYEKMALGRDKLEYYSELIRRNPNPSQKEQEEFDDMKLVREMYARGYSFWKLDLYRAGATRCRIIDGRIMPALNSVSGLGDTQAIAIEEEAKKGPFLSKDDFRERTRVSKTIVDLLEELGVLGGIPESNQISLFDLV